MNKSPDIYTFAERCTKKFAKVNLSIDTHLDSCYNFNRERNEVAQREIGKIEMTTAERINEMVTQLGERKPEIFTRQSLTDYESSDNFRKILEMQAEIDQIRAERGAPNRIDLEKRFERLVSKQSRAYNGDVQIMQNVLNNVKAGTD